MTMKKKYAIATALTGLVLGNQAEAHVGYRNIDLLNPFLASVTSDHGWAEGADGTWSDSHHLRWYRFSLASDADVEIRVSNAGPGTHPGYNASGVQSVINGVPSTFTSVGDIDPAFSLYRGLLATPPAPAVYENAVWDHDGDSNTPKVPTYSVADHAPAGSDGLFNALGDVTLGNDAGQIFTIQWLAAVNDHAGTAPETLLIHLAAGDYSLAVGGGDANGTNVGTFAVTAQVSHVPIPAAVWLFGSALAGVSVFGRRAKAHAA